MGGALVCPFRKCGRECKIVCPGSLPDSPRTHTRNEEALFQRRALREMLNAASRKDMDKIAGEHC
jgi:hypothetical protein